jgi:hypothetical protein
LRFGSAVLALSGAAAPGHMAGSGHGSRQSCRSQGGRGGGLPLTRAPAMDQRRILRQGRGRLGPSKRSASPGSARAAPGQPPAGAPGRPTVHDALRAAVVGAGDCLEALLARRVPQCEPNVLVVELEPLEAGVAACGRRRRLGRWHPGPWQGAMARGAAMPPSPVPGLAADAARQPHLWWPGCWG